MTPLAGRFIKPRSGGLRSAGSGAPLAASQSHMLMKIIAAFVTVLTLLALDLGAFAQSDMGFKLVVNADNPVSALDTVKIAKMFLKKIPRWDNGIRVIPVDQAESSDVRAAFSESIHKKSVSAIKSYWQRMIFSGRDVSPEELPSDAAVLTYVRGEPGAIGYVARDTVLGPGIKELKVNG